MCTDETPSYGQGGSPWGTGRDPGHSHGGPEGEPPAVVASTQ